MDKKEEGKKRGENKWKRERKTKRGFRFSLRSMKIGPSIFVGARGKVDPRNEGYAWVPKSGSFVKLQEVGKFSTLIIYSVKAI